MALETVLVTVVDDQVVPQPVDGVVVRVFDATGATFITEATTGGVNPGEVDFSLNGDDPPIQYSLRFSKFGFSALSPQAIEVYSPPANSPTGTNNFEVSGSEFVLPTAADIRCCRVSGYIYDGACRPRRGIDMHFIPQFSPLKVDKRGVLGERVTHRTDKDGYLQIDLWRDGCYQVVIESHENVVRSIVVPDRSSVDLMCLLFPVVELIEYSPASPFSLSVGDELEVTPTITASDFQILAGTANGDILWETEDPTIASVTVGVDSLIIRGNAIGTTNLVATRKDQTVIHVPDTGITGTPAAITVS